MGWMEKVREKISKLAKDISKSERERVRLLRRGNGKEYIDNPSVRIFEKAIEICSSRDSSPTKK